MYKKLLILFIILFVSHLSAENVGKISGVVKDSESGSPLPGVNVLIEGTYLGASTDLDGYYVILNVPVGQHTVVASFVGYQDMSINGVTVSVDLNTEVSFKLVPTTLELSEAIVDSKIKYREIPDIKPLFRLNPPKGGYEGIKRSFTNGGALGYRGKDINKLIGRMI